jgi:predicted metal-dependent peptidase
MKEFNYKLLEDKLQKARLRAVDATVGWPYLSRGIYAIRSWLWTDQVPVAAMDRWWRIYFNPHWVESTDDIHTIASVIVHEIWHALLRHFELFEVFVRDTSKMMTWNIATDCAINQIDNLIKSLPDGSLHPQQFNMPENLSAIEYFKILDQQTPEESKKGSKGQGSDQNNGSGKTQETNSCSGNNGNQSGGETSASGNKSKSGSGEKNQTRIPKSVATQGSATHGQRQAWEKEAPGPGGNAGDSNNNFAGISDAEAKQIAREVAKEIVAHAKKHRGAIPGWLQREASVVAESKVPWQQELRAAIKNRLDSAKFNRRRPTYKKISRRTDWFGSGIVLPGRSGYCPRVAVIIDTSGSMNQNELDSCFSEIAGILKSVSAGAPVKLVCADTQIHTVKSLRSVGDLVSTEMRGGGGTDMAAVMAKVAEVIEGCDVLVVLTDGYTPWPNSPIEDFGLIVVGILTRNNLTEDCYVINNIPDWLKSGPGKVVEIPLD